MIADTPRLNLLVPEQLAGELIRVLLDRVTKAKERLAPSIRVEITAWPDGASHPLQTRIGRSMAGLVHYAKVGYPMAPAEAQDAIVELADVLWPGQVACWDDEPAPFSADSPFGVAFLAARGRLRLVASAPVPAPELAALASVDPSRVRQLVGERGLLRDARSGLVTYASAIVWLEGRRVHGFSRPASLNPKKATSHARKTMSKAKTADMIEVYEVEPGKGRAGFSHKPGALEFLPADGPLPQPGDIILLPRNVTGDSEEQAFIMMGLATPFRVVEREHMYIRPLGEEHDPLETKPAGYVKSWIFVRRVSKEEYGKDPGTFK